jgi:23S rRNA (guanosine2251-2'-O)-methyltransferase
MSYIGGKNAVAAVLATSPERVTKVLVAEQLRPDKRIDAILTDAKTHGIPFNLVPRNKLDTFMQDHQGVVAMVAEQPLLDLHEFMDLCRPRLAENPLVLALDAVTDPRNVGAMLRIADAVGAIGVLMPKHHVAASGPALEKAASGAQVARVRVSNLTRALASLKKMGFWSVGATCDPQAPLYTQVNLNMPTVLVMGSEGEGLSRLVDEACDFHVRIPMRGRVESLNVSAAAAVLCYEWVRQSLLQ